MRILITGGAGFIGSALARALDSDGHRVEVLDSFRRGKDMRVPAHVTRYRGDIRNAELVDHAVSNSDTIIHCAYVQGTQTFYADPRRVIDVALTGIMNVLKACERYGDRELILVSSSEAYQVAPVPTGETVALTVPDVTNPRYSYGAGKIASEVAAMAYAHAGKLKRLVIARPHNIYGPDAGADHVIPQFALRMAKLNGEPFRIQGTGLETRSFCHIDDCVDAFRILLDRGEDKTVYHVGNDEEIEIRNLARMVATYFSNHDVAIAPSELPKGSPPRRQPDLTRIRALGYTPAVSLPVGLTQTLDWYAEHA